MNWMFEMVAKSLTQDDPMNSIQVGKAEFVKESIFVQLPEDIPKPKSLITSASDDGLSVRRHRQVENSVAVTC